MDNMIIESDNLIALKRLELEYSEQIDLIVIDPPYNTKIANIGYKDHFVENDWISFMKPRLESAYKLLSITGVMFVHIDENELINLSQLCYNIFDYKNVSIMIWKKINEKFDKNRIEKPIYNIKSSHEYVILCYKNRIDTHLNNMQQPKYIDGSWIDFNQPMESVLDNLGTTSSAKDELCDLLGSRVLFSTPKPMRLAKEMIRVATNKKSIILDFFAGSGTTGHAVMDLNKEDFGTRKFVLITNNENNICKEITIPRIESSIRINGYLEKIIVK